MEKREENETQDLEFLDTETVVKEFVRRPGTSRMNSKRTLQKKRRKRQADHSQWLWLAGFCIVWLAVVICGIALCKASAVTVILVAILEAALSLCLCRSQIWLHGLVIILNIVLGIIFHLTVFLILVSLIYLAGVILMHCVIEKHWGRR